MKLFIDTYLPYLWFFLVSVWLTLALLDLAGRLKKKPEPALPRADRAPDGDGVTQ